MEGGASSDLRAESRPDRRRRKDGEMNILTKESRGAKGSRKTPSPSTVQQAIDLVFETDCIMKGHVHDAIGTSREQDRRKYLEEIKALRWSTDPTVPELVNFISRAFETDQRFVRTVGGYAKQGKDGREGGFDLEGEGFHSGDEPPNPPRRSNVCSRWLMYMFSWKFVGDIIFWIFIALLGLTIFHRVFIEPDESELSSAPQPPNYYAILNINPNATDREVRYAYRRMALTHHPDKIKMRAGGGKGSKQNAQTAAEERMRLILDAYKTLSSGEDRCTYDYYEWPGSKGAVPLANTENRARQHWRCLIRVQRRLFTKGFNDVKNARNRGEGEKQEAKAEEETAKKETAEEEKENVEAENVEEADVEVEKEGMGRGSAAPTQDMALRGSVFRKRFLECVAKAGAAYYMICYGDAVARTVLFALVNAITWKIDVQLPGICLGGG